MRQRPRGWGLLAAAAAAALLFSFGRAVQGVMAQGQLRNVQTQERAQAQWRCNTIADREARKACRAALP